MEIPQDGGHHQASFPPPSPLSPPLSPTSAAASALANARWMPTKEQIAVLEGLYGQGLRTPTAEQIQQITARLREHGHIEGKNVFYWFQNHKARQRQKQKQQSFDYFSKLLRRPPPLPVLHRAPAPPFPVQLPASQITMPPAPAPPSCSNGVMYRRPCYMPAAQGAANAAYYPHPQMPVLYPVQTPTTMYLQPAPNKAGSPLHVLNFPPANVGGGAADVGAGRETLQLFPLQSTFVLPDKARRTGSASLTPSASASFSGESERSESPNGEARPFYDFFGVHSGGR